jgi:endonuclease III
MSAPSTLASVPTILERLHKTYPDARYELNWDHPLQLLAATILAAPCHDPESVSKKGNVTLVVGGSSHESSPL